MLSFTCSVFFLMTAALAADHTVTVGGSAGLVYTPSSVNAAVGDTVTFVFQTKNHTVTQSTLDNPCTPAAGGFDSGFHPVGANDTDFPVASLTVQSTDPVWIYCRQTSPAPHCGQGMVFGLNPQSSDQMTQFVSNAKATASNSSTATQSSSSTTATSTASASAATHTVTVGDNGALAFSPANITAQPGDTVTFQFRAKNHTITQSSFPAPCRALGATSGTAGFDSGFMPVAAGATTFPTFSITINDTNPVWAYCKQTNPSSHCGQKMVFSVNAVESSAKSFEAFSSLAQQLNGSSSSGSQNGTQSSGAVSIGRSAVLSLMVVALGVLFS